MVRPRTTLGSQPYRETLDPEIPARPRWRSEVVANAQITHERRSREQPKAAQYQGRSAVRTEFHRLCAAARCRVSLFGGSKVLSSWRAILCAGVGNRRGRKKRSGARVWTGV